MTTCIVVVNDNQDCGDESIGVLLAVQGSNDAIFVPTEGPNQPEELAFIGVKIKEALIPSDLDEGLAQFFTWGLHSYSAYIQVNLPTLCWLQVVSCR